MSYNHFGYIYKTTNIQSGLIYIGQHKWDRDDIDKNYIGSGSQLLKAINVYGRENFCCEILEWAISQDDLDNKERYWISELNATNPRIGYNVLPGGHIDSEYISIGVKRFYSTLTDEQRLQRRLSVLGERNPMYGKHHTEETKKIWK